MKWNKIGKIFEQIKPGWSYSQSPAAIILKDKIRIFFATRPIGVPISRIAYVDFDHNFKNILSQSEPVLALGGRGSFDEFGTNPISAINYNNEIRIVYSGWTRCESVPFETLVGMAISVDEGNTFKKIGNGGPLLATNIHDPFVIGSPRIKRFNDMWFIWYIAGKQWLKDQCIYAIKTSFSKDGLTWTRGKDFIINGDAKECQASPEVFFLNGKYHMLFSYRHFDSRNYSIGYASSADLITWHRDDSQAGISVSSEGWDSESISYPNIFELNGKYCMLYQGNGIGKSGFGLAQLEIEQ